MPALSLLFFFIFERSVLIALVFYKQRYARKGSDAKNPAILGIFHIEKTQLNATHEQLLEKLRPIGFAENTLEFQEIWQKNSSETT